MARSTANNSTVSQSVQLWPAPLLTIGAIFARPSHWPAQDGRGGTSGVQSPLALECTLPPVTVIVRYRYPSVTLSPIMQHPPLSPVTVIVRYRYHRYRQRSVITAQVFPQQKARQGLPKQR